MNVDEKNFLLFGLKKFQEALYSDEALKTITGLARARRFLLPLVKLEKQIFLEKILINSAKYFSGEFLLVLIVGDVKTTGKLAKLFENILN